MNMGVDDFSNNVFRLPSQCYGSGETERAVEVPWALSCVDASRDRRVLDVGYAYAEPLYLDRLISLEV